MSGPLDLRVHDDEISSFGHAGTRYHDLQRPQHRLIKQDIIEAGGARQGLQISGCPRFCLGYEGLVPEQLATKKNIEIFPSSSGRENLHEHSVTCCKVDRISGRDASDKTRWPKIAMQQVSLNNSVLRLHDSFTMPLLLP
jgi:hypothetical protein